MCWSKKKRKKVAAIATAASFLSVVRGKVAETGAEINKKTTNAGHCQAECAVEWQGEQENVLSTTYKILITQCNKKKVKKSL